MGKNIIISRAVSLLLIILLINAASAYTHASVTLSDKISFKEDIKGENRGFTLERSVDVPRLTPQGYYDWSYNPNIIYPSPNSYKISDKLALEAFKTFQTDSREQTKIELEKLKYRYQYKYGYYRYSPYRYYW